MVQTQWPQRKTTYFQWDILPSEFQPYVDKIQKVLCLHYNKDVSTKNNPLKIEPRYSLTKMKINGYEKIKLNHLKSNG